LASNQSIRSSQSRAGPEDFDQEETASEVSTELETELEIEDEPKPKVRCGFYCFTNLYLLSGTEKGPELEGKVALQQEAGL
jgi:hypothetical protein